jgi:hypothetical protein
VRQEEQLQQQQQQQQQRSPSSCAAVSQREVLSELRPQLYGPYSMCGQRMAAVQAAMVIV